MLSRVELASLSQAPLSPTGDCGTTCRTAESRSKPAGVSALMPDAAIKPIGGGPLLTIILN